MRIAKVTVADGVAHVEIEGLEVPVIVREGESIELALTAESRTLQFVNGTSGFVWRIAHEAVARST